MEIGVRLSRNQRAQEGGAESETGEAGIMKPVHLFSAVLVLAAFAIWFWLERPTPKEKACLRAYYAQAGYDPDEGALMRRYCRNRFHWEKK